MTQKELIHHKFNKPTIPPNHPTTQPTNSRNLFNCPNCIQIPRQTYTLKMTSGWNTQFVILLDRWSYCYITAKGKTILSVSKNVRGARGVMVIIVGNEHGDTSSNPGRD